MRPSATISVEDLVYVEIWYPPGYQKLRTIPIHHAKRGTFSTKLPCVTRDAAVTRKKDHGGANKSSTHAMPRQARHRGASRSGLRAGHAAQDRVHHLGDELVGYRQVPEQ